MPEDVLIAAPLPITAVAVAARSPDAGWFGAPDLGERIGLYLIVSRMLADHALFYVFIADAPPAERVAEWAKLNEALFGYDLVVLDMGERPATMARAETRAAALKAAAAHANVVWPPFRLAEGGGDA